MVEIEETKEIDLKLNSKDSEKDEKVNLWGGLDAASILEKFWLRKMPDEK